MFSGIVEKMAPVISVERTEGKSVSLGVVLGRLAKDAKVDESIAVNGVCLTVTRKRGGTVWFDVIEETRRRINLGDLSQDARVNIEKSLLLSDRIGGHLVTGHIDGKGKIAKVEPEIDASVKMWIETGVELLAQMIPKGSVAIDGISMTLVDISKNSFSICLIPHTLAITTLGYRKPGDSVNIEVDMIGKFVRKFLEQMNLTLSPAHSSRTMVP
jgi:riboflavin synthase